MKNSQYVNQGNCSTADMFRLTLNEIVNNEIVHVATFAMHPDFAEHLANTMLQTVEGHKRAIELQKEENKKLS